MIYGPDGQSVAPCSASSAKLIERITGPLSESTADALRASLSAAQGALKLPHPAPAPSASLASGLFAPDSLLFKSASPDPSADVNQTNPADPSQAPTGKAPSGDAHKQLALGLARMLEVPLGLKLEQASLRWAGWESTTSFGGSDAAPEGGYQSLVDKVLGEASANGAEVKLSTAISSIKQNDQGVVVSGNGAEFQGKTVICTIPLGVLKTLPENTFSPALPPRLSEAIKGTHVGILEKLLLQYESAWWPNPAKVGSYTFLPTSTTPLTANSTPQEIFESSTLICANFACPTLPNPSPVLLTYLSETPATALTRFEPGQVAQAYHDFLVSRFKPETKPPGPIDSSLTDWLTDPLSRGATTTPSIISENGERSPLDFKELGRPVWDGKLGFAGEHTEMEHRGSVAGAVISGQREAARVDRLLNLYKQD